MPNEVTLEQEQQWHDAINRLLAGQHPNGDAGRDFGSDGHNALYRAVLEAFDKQGATGAKAALGAALRMETELTKRFSDWLAVVAETPSAGAVELSGTQWNSVELNGTRGTDKRRWQITHADAILNLPPVEWLIDGLLPVNDLSCLYGASGAGKSHIALTVAQTYPVVYVAAEAIQSYAERMKAWCAFRKAGRGNLYFCTDAINLADTIEVMLFIEYVKPLRPALIIYDTLARCGVGLDENSSRDMGILVDNIERIRRQTGAAQQIVHHTGKSGDMERGSSALRGACSTMTKLTNDDGLIRVHCDKSRSAKPFDDLLFRLVEVEESESVVPLPASSVFVGDEISPRKQEIIDYLALAIHEGQYIAQKDIIDATRIPKSSMSRLLSELYVSRLIDKGPQGKVKLLPVGVELATDSGKIGETHGTRLSNQENEGKTPLFNWHVQADVSAIRSSQVPASESQVPPSFSQVPPENGTEFS
jgi:uncharacterized membrane protein